MKYNKLIFASHNEGKIKEIREILAPFNIEILSANDIHFDDVEETGTTFKENAILKAETIAKATNIPCFADDSGLCVEALNFRPGVYTARYAPNRDMDKGMDKLLEEMKNKDNRNAFFMCVIALANPSGEIYTFDDKCEGVISTFKSGAKGFGFDPIFVPNGYNTTFAEISKEEKNKISHRGKALNKFITFISNNI